MEIVQFNHILYFCHWNFNKRLQLHHKRRTPHIIYVCVLVCVCLYLEIHLLELHKFPRIQEVLSINQQVTIKYFITFRSSFFFSFFNLKSESFRTIKIQFSTVATRKVNILPKKRNVCWTCLHLNINMTFPLLKTSTAGDLCQYFGNISVFSVSLQFATFILAIALYYCINKLCMVNTL